MNTNDSPLIPQGSFLEQRNKGRARVRIAVFVVLAIHGIGLMALLMQGCKPSVPPTDTTLTDTNAVTTAPAFEPTNEPFLPDTNVPLTAASNQPLVAPEPVATTTLPPVVPPPAAGTEYKIAKGDTFAGLAKKFGVSIKAITDANPGIDPTRLQIGQTVTIPAASAPANGSGTTSATGSNGSQSYVVKSGDSLTKIANDFGITVKALRTANDLKTDRIRVGQRLKIPPKPVAPAFTAPGGDPAATTPTNR